MRELGGATVDLEAGIAEQLVKRFDDLESAEPSEKVVADLRTIMRLAGQAASHIRSDSLTALHGAAQVAAEAASVACHKRTILSEIESFEAGASSLGEFWRVWKSTRTLVVFDSQMKEKVSQFEEHIRESFVIKLHNLFADGEQQPDLEEADMMEKALHALNEDCSCLTSSFPATKEKNEATSETPRNPSYCDCDVACFARLHSQTRVARVIRVTKCLFNLHSCL